MIEHKELIERLHYNEDTGVFTWVKPTNRRIIYGAVAGSKRKEGSIQININGKIYLANRLAWFYVCKKWPIGQIMHINHIKDDNRFCNLKDVPFNSNKQKESIKAYYDKRYNTWIASRTLYGKHIHIGRFCTEQEAKEATIKHRIELERQGIL